jgi:Acetyltransferases
MENITYEQIEDKHVDVLYNLNQIIFKEEILYDLDFIKEYCNKREGYIAKKGNKYVGYVICGKTYSPEIYKTVFTIISIGVLKEYRKMGIGKKLLKIVIEKNDYEDIYLHVRITNEIAKNLYLKEGFEIISLSKNYYNLIKNGPEDAYVMRRKSLKLILKNKLSSMRVKRL